MRRTRPSRSLDRGFVLPPGQNGALMLRPVCAADGSRTAGKLASLYWAWFNANGERTAWKQRLCAAHAEQRLADLLAHSNDASGSASLCPSCGTSSEQDLDPIYLTVYAPHTERLDLELATCAPCAVSIRISAQEGAERLPNREQTITGSGRTADGAREAVSRAWGWMR